MSLIKKVTLGSILSVLFLSSVGYAANLWYGVGIPVPSSAPPTGQAVTTSMAVYNYSGTMSGTPSYTVSSNWSNVSCKTANDVAKIISSFKSNDFPLSPPSPIECWKTYGSDNYGFKLWTHPVQYDYQLHSGTWFSSTADDIDLTSDAGEIVYYKKLPSGSTWTVQQVDCKKGPLFINDWTGVDAQVVSFNGSYYGYIRITPTASEGSGRCAFHRSGQSTQQHKIDLDRI